MTVDELLASLTRYKDEGCGDWEIQIVIRDGGARVYGDEVEIEGGRNNIRGSGSLLIMAERC